MPRFTFPDAPGDLIGAHVSTKGGLHTVFERAAAIEASALALFAKNSNQWKGKVLTDDDVAQFASLRTVGPILTHASYLINLATTNEEFHRKSIAAMIDELDRAERLGIHAVVLHPGAHLNAGVDAGIDQIARSLDQVHAAIPNHRVVTLLETAAGQGSCLGCTFEELGRIVALVDDKHRVGVCFDTCHAHAAGYDLLTDEGYQGVFDDFQRLLGIQTLRAFHLNDSKTPVGSHVDRHEEIGDGFLGRLPFWRLVNDPRFARIPGVLETPSGPDKKPSFKRNLERLRALVGAPRPTEPPPKQELPDDGKKKKDSRQQSLF